MHNTTFIRSLILTFFTAISPSLALAQKNVGTKPLKRLEATHDDEDVETVLEIDEGAFYGYGGFRAGTQYIDSKFVNVVGFRAAWLFNRNISIGLDASSSSYKPF